MGKVDTKKDSTLRQDGNQQRKISSFFQSNTTAGPVESKLFSSVGSVPKPSKQSMKKRVAQPSETSVIKKHIATAETKLSVSKKPSADEISRKSSAQSSQVDYEAALCDPCIPETQFVSPSKPVNSASLVDKSPDIVMIPDTPEEDRSGFGIKKRKVFSSRSFLSMNADPIKRAPPPKIVRKPVSKYFGQISVTFNNPGTKMATETDDTVHGEYCKKLKPEDFSNDIDDTWNSRSEEKTPTKSCNSDRVKRLAKSGLSPTPKRTLCLDVVPDMEDIENSPPESLSFPTSKSNKSPNLTLPQPKPERKSNVEKILSHMKHKPSNCKGVTKKLTSYQIGGSASLREQDSGLSDDDVLGEILGELGTKSVSNPLKSDKTKKKGHVKSSGTVDKSPKGTLNVGAITEEEMELFRTLDESFGTGTEDQTHDSESPSIIMPKRIRPKKSKIPPVKDLLLTHPQSCNRDIKGSSINKSSEISGDRKDIDIDVCEVTSQESCCEVEISQSSEDSSSQNSEIKGSLSRSQTPTSQTSSQELCEEFEHLTPFKDKMGSQVSELPVSVRPADRFNRYTVTSVVYNRDDTVLGLESDGGDNRAKNCILHGFWMDTHVAEGDIVHILADLDPKGVYQVTDKMGLIVVCPDLLLSGTSVVSGVHCMRRSALNEKFRGCDDKSIHMLFGSIIHCLFQQVLKQKLLTEKQMMDTAMSVMKLNKFLHEMYTHMTNETVVKEEINKYIPTLKQWVEKYSALVPQTTNAASDDLKVTKIHDIEENIWSPRFGVKGKIDLTVEVQLNKSKKQREKKILPLELKTGKPTFSIEHKGQVTLYSMMMSDRRTDPEEGLLLYLREPIMTNIQVKGENKRGLLQLRNELAHFVRQQVTKTTMNGHVTFQYGQLPKPINSVRSCSKCPQLLNCAVYQRHIEDMSHHKGHAMETLIPDTLSHLSPSHIDYFLHWSVCLELERQVERGKKVKDIWCASSQDRERQGDCLSGMMIQHTEVGLVTDSQRYAEGDSCVITFTRHSHYARRFPAPLHTLGFAVSDSLSISSDDGRLLVLATGFIRNICDTSVEIVVDRDVFHEDATLKTLIYRLDRCDNFNTLGYLFTNLSRLLENQHSKERLRKLIIEKKKPEFQLTMSKGIVERVKPIFKSLNMPQKTVILKVLMCKDYVLVKGYPGTGKTSTIVALVQVLTTIGQSILLTSYTHSAVDNILLKLKKHNVNFVRLGRLGRIHPGIHDHSAEVLTSKITSVHELHEFYDSQMVVATSCLGVNHPIFSQRKFDVCIVDEASQVLQPACLGPLFAAERFVLVGDPKQLPPVVQSKESLELGMSESLFARLDDAGATFDLNLQYRMNKTIMHLSNELIYKGLLQCGSSTVAESCLPLSGASRLADIVSGRSWLQDVLTSDLDKAAVFLDTSKVPAPELSDGKGMLKNITEAEIVLVVVTALVEYGVTPDDIGVIAPYRHQVKHLQQQLHKRHLVGVEANTVDQYQGRDKSVIVMSFVRSSPQPSNRTGELLQDVRRLNVAVTRAKHKLVLVGDLPTLSVFQPLQKLIHTMENKQQIIQLPPNAHC